MRHRILAELEKAASRPAPISADEHSMESLAARALDHSRKLNWRLLELSSQLRISTIDSFCRDLAIQEPIHSGIGNNLQINERPAELYRVAVRATLEKLGDPEYPDLSNAIQSLLLWRDNNWKELEELLVNMLGQRDRWMLDFVLTHEQDWDLVRERLERPFANAVRAALENLENLLTHDDRAEAHELAQFACAHGAGDKYQDLAELAHFPSGSPPDADALEEARTAYLCVANLLLTNEGNLRQKIDNRLGFPKEHLDEKLRMQDLLGRVADVPGLEDALAAVRSLPPARYTDEDWQILRAAFLLLRHAAAELRAAFAESGTVDFIEVAQLARHVLQGEDNQPSDAAQAVADDIRHLLVDEFQDTSRRQHEFITALIRAWPDQSGRTIFVVGDPMQSIYFFRDAEAELFRRVKDFGFELGDGDSFPVHPVALSANFRTDPALVSDLNEAFERVFSLPDGSGIQFAKAEPARAPAAAPNKRLELHLAFAPQTRGNNSSNAELIAERDQIRKSQLAEIISLVRDHLSRIDSARTRGEKYRIAILGRARTALAPIASALREAQIPFRAVELEGLRDRPEILDAVALTRALLNPEDRVAWLGVLRAPWCGLSLAELHTIAGTDEGPRSAPPIPQLLRERMHLLPAPSRTAAQRVLNAFASVGRIRATLATASVGTLIQQVWRALGGDRCIDNAAGANLDLFWRLLDRLPQGEQDLAGAALDAALQDLCALPDPGSSSDRGVQLMTIHKSKGLEFEIVIVPDLHAEAGRGSVELLYWLERGLAEPNDDGELTEFLIAPVQFKGTDPGAAKRWVIRARDAREAQEMRRILYVAATRAREELHLFAQPAYKRDAENTQKLLDPRNCLLATAWPALAGEIRTRFDQWKNSRQESLVSSELILDSIAAQARDNLIVMPSPATPTILSRLPPDFEPKSAIDIQRTSSGSVIGLREGDTYARHEGGLLSRALGNAVHSLLEQLARFRNTLDWDSARAAIENTRPRALAALRSCGLSETQAQTIAATAFDIAIQASRDPSGEWILSPHTEAASESGWAGLIGSHLQQIRIDRLFRAGLQPLATGDAALWIIDYKTAHADNIKASTLSTLRATFAPQLETYAKILRNVHGPSIPLRAGLYYPRMSTFDWWEIEVPRSIP
jgi:ATP-dependent helicase/nuclease subunit A